jgi:hypothetical protein
LAWAFIVFVYFYFCSPTARGLVIILDNMPSPGFFIILI